MKEEIYWPNLIWVKIVSYFLLYAAIWMINNFLQDMRIIDALCETPFNAILFSFINYELSAQHKPNPQCYQMYSIRT